MTDLSQIHTVILVDGYGRKYTTIDAKEIRTMTDHGTMWIRHDGDTSHASEGGERYGT
jgi:hypothetical protein